MALEKDVITTKLTEEGISEKLGTGLSFETEGELNSWVEDFKTAIPAPSKKLEEYTKDELEELAKDQSFGGAKGLQAYIDSVRTKAKFSAKPEDKKKPEDKTDDEPPAWAKQLIEDNQKLKTQSAEKEFESLLNKVGKSESLSDVHIARVKKGLKSDATEADIKAEIVSYKKELASIGVKEFGTPGSGGKGNSSIAGPAKAWADKQKKTKK